MVELVCEACGPRPADPPSKGMVAWFKSLVCSSFGPILNSSGVVGTGGRLGLEAQVSGVHRGVRGLWRVPFLCFWRASWLKGQSFAFVPARDSNPYFP